MTTIKEILGTTATILGTGEIGGLTNNSSVVGATVYDNTAGSGSSSTSGDGYERAYVTFVPGADFSAAPTANTSIDIYFLKSLDGGTSYEGGSSSVLPPRAPDLMLPLTTSTVAADNQITRVAFLPACKFKALAKNNATGQTIPAGSTIKLVPCTDEGV